MKFFTQEWYHNTLISQMCFSIRKSNRAAIFSDKFFEKLYKSEKAWYVKHLKRAAKFTRTPFDKVVAEAEFDQNYKDNLEFVNALPQELISEIADIRVFALGTVSYDIADKLTRFCGKLNRECEAIQKEYDDSLEFVAEKIGWTPINMLNALPDAEINSVTEVDSTLTITTNERKIILESGKPTLELVGARVIAFEIVENNENDKYVLGLLCEDTKGELFDECINFKAIIVEEIN
jgi:putative heme iron utilization protein